MRVAIMTGAEKGGILKTRLATTLLSRLVCAVGGLACAAGLAAADPVQKIEVRLPQNPGGHERLQVDFDASRSAPATITLTTRGKPYRDTGFFCQKLKKKNEGLRCSGDDDSGRFSIRGDTIAIDFLNLNVEGEKILSYRGNSRPLKFTVLHSRKSMR